MSYLKNKPGKIHPKDVQLNIPIALLFEKEEEINVFASNINMILHGKQKLKSEELGKLGDKFVGLFYITRNAESQSIRDEFLRLIDIQEVGYSPSDKEVIEEVVEYTHFIIKDDVLYCGNIKVAENIDGCFEFLLLEDLEQYNEEHEEDIDWNYILGEAEKYLTNGKHPWR